MKINSNNDILKTREKDKQTVNKIIDILIAEFQKNKENNGDIQNIIHFLWEDMSLVLASKKLIYAIAAYKIMRFPIDLLQCRYIATEALDISYTSMT